MLRAAYFGQELLSTFGMQIGEIALIPATGGLFTVELVRHRNIQGPEKYG
jgi:predicted Rdx family selenoprotein